MVLLVEKINLAVQFLNDFLVLVLIELHGELVIILTALVELAQTQDFNITLFNLLISELELGFEFLISFSKVFTPHSHFVRSLIRFAKLSSPFLVT